MSKIDEILSLPFHIYLACINYLPGRIGHFLRYHYWNKRLGALGYKSIIGPGVQFIAPKNIHIGDHCWIDQNTILIAGISDRQGRDTVIKSNSNFKGERGNIYIKNRVHLAPNVVINGIGGVYIDHDSCIASGCKVYSYSHHYRQNESSKQYSFSSMSKDEDQTMISGPISIGCYAAVGLNSVILPSVHVGNGSWIATLTTVKKSIPDQHILSNNELKKIENLSLPSS